MPNLRTGPIMKLIINKRDRYTIFGQKGTGKSFAYFIYDYLATFLIDYRISLINSSEKPSKCFYFFVPMDQLIKFKKLFYIPIKGSMSFANCLGRLSHQSPLSKSLSILSLVLQNEPITVSAFMAKMSIYYTLYNIKTVMIFDETNAYYSLIRQMLANNDFNNSRAKFYSELFECSY